MFSTKVLYTDMKRKFAPLDHNFKTHECLVLNGQTTNNPDKVIFVLISALQGEVLDLPAVTFEFSVIFGAVSLSVTAVI